MDVTHDNSWGQWSSIAGTYEVPPYVLDYPVLTKEAAEKLDDNLFADPVNKQFPLESKAATWLSAAYFNENRSGLEPVLGEYVEGRIKAAAAMYGISGEVGSVLVFRHAVIDPESDPSNYGYIAEDGSRYYPMFDAEGVKRASEHFEQYRSEYPAPVRRKIASAIAKKSAQDNVGISMAVFREAGMGYPNRVDLADNLLDRAHLTVNEDVKALVASMGKLAAMVAPEELYDNLDKIAEVVDTIDRLNGMDKAYGRKLLAPSDFLYSMTSKQANDLQKDALHLNQYTFSITKLAALDPDIFKAALGDDMFDAISVAGKLDLDKMAAVLPTLPRPDKMALEEYITACCDE